MRIDEGNIRDAVRMRKRLNDHTPCRHPQHRDVAAGDLNSRIRTETQSLNGEGRSSASAGPRGIYAVTVKDSRVVVEIRPSVTAIVGDANAKIGVFKETDVVQSAETEDSRVKSERCAFFRRGLVIAHGPDTHYRTRLGF